MALRNTLTALLALLVCPTAAWACEDAPENGIPDPSVASWLPQAIGDPAGVRAALARRGVAFGVNYIGEVFGNTSGGFKQDAHYDGLVDMYFDANLEKSLGFKGLCFHANAYQIHGTSITTENLGSLMPVSYIEATPATRLFEMYFEQDLFDKTVSIRIGQLSADSQFVLTDGGGAFINGTWGWDSLTATNLPSGGPAYPLATPGISVTVRPNDKFTLLAGLYNGDPAGTCPESDDPQVCNPDGLSFRIKDAPLVMYEGAYAYDAGGLAGSVKAGGWVQGGRFQHQRLDANGISTAVSGGNPGLLDNDYGFYGIINQTVYQAPDDASKTILAFARVVGSPSDRNFVEFYAETGLVFTGMVPSRPNDIAAVGFAYTGISSEVAALDQESGSAVVHDYEALFEASYTAMIAKGWTLQPDFQYLWHPGGHAVDPATGLAVKDAAVLGVRTSVNY